MQATFVHPFLVAVTAIPADGLRLEVVDVDGDDGGEVYRELRARGLSEQKAARAASNNRSWWRNSGPEINIPLPASHVDNLGVPRLAT